jgi:hypothetical protein
MKIVNSTSFPDYFLRRLVSYCCKDHGLKVREIRTATFRNRSDSSYSGHAWWGSREICVSVRKSAHDTPMSRIMGPRLDDPDWAMKWDEERIDHLVKVTAHEVAHIMLHVTGSKTRQSRRYGTVSSGGSEHETNRHEKYVFDSFNKDRYALLKSWMKPSTRVKADKVGVRERRAVHASKKLAEWERKMKRAETASKKWRAKVRYYERVMK